MASINWVHLSDWHQRGVDFDRMIVRDALIRDVEERGRSFSMPGINLPAWKIWLVNDPGIGQVWSANDTDELGSGWHNFIVRWDHSQPLLELLIDGRTEIATSDYLAFWPTRFAADIMLGAWPQHWSEHYVDTCIARWQAACGSLPVKILRFDVWHLVENGEKLFAAATCCSLLQTFPCLNMLYEGRGEDVVNRQMS